MTAELEENAAPSGEGPDDGSFAAQVRYDRYLESSVIVLSYEARTNPARSMRVEIAPDLGSNMFRFRAGEHDLIYTDRELLKARGFTGNFVLWPLPNRIRDKSYVYQGQSYSLADVMRPQGNSVLIHGLVFDRAWSHDEPIAGREAASVTTSMEITPGSPHYHAYPFDSRLALTYTLTRDGVAVTYTIINRGSRTLPHGFALHPYFATLSGADGTWVSIPADAVMEADDDLLPTGRLLPLDGIMYAMFDLREPVPLGHLKLDHVYAALHPGESAVVDYRTLGFRLRLSATDDFTHMVIYTPSTAGYLCLENQTCATDAVNLHARGLRELAHLLEVAPGESRSGTIRYTVDYPDDYPEASAG